MKSENTKFCMVHQIGANIGLNFWPNVRSKFLVNLTCTVPLRVIVSLEMKLSNPAILLMNLFLDPSWFCLLLLCILTLSSDMHNIMFINAKHFYKQPLCNPLTSNLLTRLKVFQIFQTNVIFFMQVFWWSTHILRVSACPVNMIPVSHWLMNAHACSRLTGDYSRPDAQLVASRFLQQMHNYDQTWADVYIQTHIHTNW